LAGFHSLEFRTNLNPDSFWSKINAKTQTPVNAVWLVVTFCTCLNLIGLGSSQTIISIFNITAPALDLSYIAVILCRRLYEHRVPFIEGPYTLGKWGPTINGIAITWVLFISVVLFFPSIRPITAANFNYAICVAAVIGAGSMSWWFISAR
jgi:amino acid transporter